jgi:TonB family protein
MFSTLLESRRATGGPLGGAVVSAGAHVVLLAAAITLVHAQPRAAVARERIAVHTLLFPIVPPSLGAGVREAPRPASRVARRGALRTPRRRALAPPTISVDLPPLELPELTVEIDYSERAANLDEFRVAGGPGASYGRGFMVNAAYPGGVYSPHQVEKLASPLPENPRPEYPLPLLRTRRQGRVDIEFVIDTLGRADTTSTRVIRSSHPLFARAVHEVLPLLHFLPAELGGRKVAMRVVQPFSFVIR